MRNVRIVNSTNIDEILSAMPASGANFTNGAYVYPIEQIQETMLAGFEFVNSQHDLPMVVAINTDASLTALGKKDFESQLERANKIAGPLTKTFPDRELIIIFYNEPTPTALFEALSKQRPGLTKTLHKWGYGTGPTEPKIEGAESFDTVYSFPMPNGHEPICYHQTERQTVPQKIQVVDLRDKLASVVKEQTQSVPTTKQNAFNRHTLFAVGAAVSLAAAVTAVVVSQYTQK